MKAHVRAFIELWDIPSGSIVGLFTLLMIGMCVHAYFHRVEIPTTVVSVYQFIIGTFAGSKAVKTIWGKAQPNDASGKE